MATPALAHHGSDQLKREFLVPAIAGECVCSIAVSEPQAGSDVAQLKTIACTVGDDYVISGSKMWITNSTQADFLCLQANTGDGPVHRNKSLIIVPTGTPGISFSERLDKLGARAYRDMRGMAIGGGSDETMLAVLSKMMGIHP